MNTTLIYMIVLVFLIYISVRNLLWSEKKELSRINAFKENPKGWKLPISAGAISIVGGLIVFNSISIKWPVFWQGLGVGLVALGFTNCFVQIFYGRQIQKHIAGGTVPSSSSILKRTNHKRLSALPLALITILWVISGVGKII